MGQRTSAIQDCRSFTNQLWNAGDLLKSFPLQGWSAGSINGECLDEFIYHGFLTHGEPFLREARGAFAVCSYDDESGRLFLVRDWAGEMPMHYVATEMGVTVANTIGGLRYAHPDYDFRWVRAVPHARYQFIDFPEQRGHTSWAPSAAVPYDALEPSVLKSDRARRSPEELLEEACKRLRSSIERRVARAQSTSRIGLLLSGGLDSFAVGIMLRDLGIEFQTFTLGIDVRSEECERARSFADTLQVSNEIVTASPTQIRSHFDDAVRSSEIYHLYNVYCAVGMLVLGEHLRARRYAAVFCGEGMNELVGDYSAWTTNIHDGDPTIIQNVPESELACTAGRVRLFWGGAPETGKYNQQLGAGLAKHGISRMVKPFLSLGVRLECPYLDPDFARCILALSAGDMGKLVGKPGLIALMLKEPIRRLGVDPELIRSARKTRLQDGGDTSITGVLINAGLRQEAAIELFNRHFGSHLDPDRDSKRILRLP